MNRILIAAVTLCLPLSAAAEAPGVVVDGAFARSANPKTGAAFMILRNDGTQDCTLHGVATGLTPSAELHTSRENAEGMMQMLPIEGGIAIPAGGEHALAPGGDHVMLMGLSTALEQGDEVPLQLDLGDCGTLDVVVPLDNDRNGFDADAMDHAGH